MSSNSDDIQAAGSDTRPPMLDRTDYESWSQRIRLYCRGKENGLQILQSIDQGPFELGTTRDTLGTTPEGGVLLGPERPRTYEDLSDTEKKRYDADVRATNIVLQGLPKDIYKLINHNIEAKAIWDNVKMLLAGSELTKEDRESQLYDEFERFKMLPGENINKFVTAVKLNKGLKETNHEQLYAYLKQHEKHAAQDRLIIERITPATNDQLAFVSTNQNQRYVARGNGAASNGGHIIELGMKMQNSDYFKDKMLLMQAQENGAVLDEEELLFLAGKQGNTFDADVDNQPVQDLALNEDNIFQADECDAFDSDVDDEPTAQTIFIANLSSVGSANPQAGLSNASNLSEVHTLENAIDHIVTNEVQQSNVIDSTSVYMGNNNVIPSEQYLSVNNISVVPSCASSTLNNVCVSSDNDAFVPHDPIANELKIYKEQVAIYEQRAKFELFEHEQRMDDQMCMLIQNRNKMEENLKKEIHSVKLQLNSTMENNKIFEETVTTLKREFKQKESKFLTDFSNLKHLNNKLENKLHSQDQSIQTVYMMLNPAQVYDQRTKTTLGAQNPFHLRQAKKAQPVLYDGEELLKTHHVPVNVPSSKEELELAEATRNKLHVKMNDSACVEKRVNITPPNYSKENFMATFTPQTQLTPEQVFWSLDLAKRKAEELKANAPPLPVLPPATVYPPNTPVHLVPRTLPTTSQVNIGLYVITQLFWDFEKTCKKRITPTGITEGERGFEQTKRCYLTESRNRTLVEAARTMLIFSKAPLFLWAEAVATACYTQNRSLIHTLHNKTPYELVHDKKPDLSFLRIFGALCYPTNDSEDLGKLKAKADIGFFVGYAPNRKGYRIYNKRTRQIMETIHVTFDELTEQTAPVHSSSGPNPNLLTPGPISSRLVPNSAPAIPYVPPTNKDLELLFQPMFDEYFETPTGDHQMTHVPAVPPPVIPTGPSVSISFDHDAPSSSHSPSSSAPSNSSYSTIKSRSLH
ncbi:retrovirus-related pol polyprotein from transposon TNT 1-94 [Tanacetum coccineum]